jgi:hypothetical protein
MGVKFDLGGERHPEAAGSPVVHGRPGADPSAPLPQGGAAAGTPRTPPLGGPGYTDPFHAYKSTRRT